MASSPGHAFWLEGPVGVLKESLAKGEEKDPEHLTGPVALKESWEQWAAAKVDEASIVILDNDVIYPYTFVLILPFLSGSLWLTCDGYVRKQMGWPDRTEQLSLLG